jgi:hypothetical protein
MRHLSGALLGMYLAACSASGQPTAAFGMNVVIPAGLEGRIYHLRHNTSKLPDFSKMKSKGAVYATSLNILPQAFDQGFPGVTKRSEWFGIDYTGRFWIKTPGVYAFQLTADDGARLFVDDGLVVDNDGLHGPRDRSGEVRLDQGVHRVRVSYFQGPRFQVALVLRVAPPGEPLRVFDMRDFKPPPSTLEER